MSAVCACRKSGSRSGLTLAGLAWSALLCLSLPAPVSVGQSVEDDCAAVRDISVVLSVVTEQFYDRSFNGLN